MLANWLFQDKKILQHSYKYSSELTELDNMFILFNSMCLFL